MIEQLGFTTEVNMYPIKSCQVATIDGERPESLEVGPTGFTEYDVRDREFALIEAEPSQDGTYLFVSQRSWGENGRLVRGRTDNKLATVETDIREGLLTVKSAVGSLALDARYFEDAHRDMYDVRVHSSLMPRAIDQGAEASMYFSELLGRYVRLVRANRSNPRWVPEAYQRSDAANQLAGADGMPFLLTSEASLAASRAANGIDEGAVSIGAYRGNIVIGGEGLKAYDEDFVRQIRIANFGAYVVKACSRCPIPNIDQVTGERQGAGLKALRGRDGSLELDGERGVFFGQNLNHIYTPGTKVVIGTPVEVLERSTERNFILSAAA